MRKAMWAVSYNGQTVAIVSTIQAALQLVRGSGQWSVSHYLDVDRALLNREGE